MRRFLIGCLLGTACFFVGFEAAGFAWPAIPRITVAEEPTPVTVGLCSLKAEPEAYDGKLVTVSADYRWFDPHVVGELQSPNCGRVRVICPSDPTGCQRLLAFQHDDPALHRSVEVTGRFLVDDRTPGGKEHRLELWRASTPQPAVRGKCSGPAGGGF